MAQRLRLASARNIAVLGRLGGWTQSLREPTDVSPWRSWCTARRLRPARSSNVRGRAPPVGEYHQPQCPFYRCTGRARTAWRVCRPLRRRRPRGASRAPDHKTL